MTKCVGNCVSVKKYNAVIKKCDDIIVENKAFKDKIRSIPPLILGFYYLNNFLNKKIHLKYFLLISFFCTLPIFYLGTDWGRYLMINYIMMQLIYFYLVLYKNISFNKNFFFKKEKLLVFFIITIFFYSFFWTVPHCCYPEFKSIYAHPFEKIFN